MIDPNEWTRFANLVLEPRKIKVEAILVHAWGDLHDEMIKFVAKLYQESGAKLIVLNGHQEYEFGAPGFDYWQKQLTKKYNIPIEVIKATKPADNTNAEVYAMLDLAQNENITMAAVVSVPMHIIRATLNHIGVINRKGLDIKIYPQTILDINWTEEIQIRSIGGCEEKTLRVARLMGEFARIVQYSTLAQKGESNFSLATVEEGLKYFKEKNI